MNIDLQLLATAATIVIAFVGVLLAVYLYHRSPAKAMRRARLDYGWQVCRQLALEVRQGQRTFHEADLILDQVLTDMVDDSLTVRDMQERLKEALRR